MNSKFKIVFLFSLSAFCFLLSTSFAQAVCPVCTVAVGACVGFSRYLGIDDTITGLWIGGLIVSMIAWTISWLTKKNIRFIGRKILVIILYYLLIIGPLYWKDVIGHPFNKIWGMDKLLLGIIAGSFFFFLGNMLHLWLKKRNGGQVYFPFQKVVAPIFILAILSVIFYFLTC